MDLARATSIEQKFVGRRWAEELISMGQPAIYVEDFYPVYPHETQKRAARTRMNVLYSRWTPLDVLYMYRQAVLATGPRSRVIFISPGHDEHSLYVHY